MAEYIEREALIEAAKRSSPICQCMADFVDVKRLIQDAPTADVAPVVHGRWVPYSNEQDRGFHCCSTCKGQAFNYEDESEVVEVLSNFCPNCGARMDKGATDGT